ncbi:Helix-turn-helix [Desulfonatronum thiosulfatophilum]|uniref:Helix-turn-helix n=1 Tax=Desulfonatronum thiosulfatophilum TaxID=617002 RepID=A0A1G6A4N7_9BACT|nr:helix-turn-helix transcriptional regulator [Desulfonatronum thiosulfatophilum]SDB03389.1 Helix-turn-helix [Desulfonatronum thiosulfatophilum]
MKLKKVKIWMLQKGIKGKDVAEGIGVSRSMVSHWLSGRYSSERIRLWFLAQGCPEGFLAKES